LPQDRADYLSAQICAVLANIHRRADAPVFDTADFIPQMRATEDDEEEDQAPVEFDVQAVSEQIRRVLGGNDNGNAR